MSVSCQPPTVPTGVVDPGRYRSPAAAPATRGPLIGVLLLVLSMWTLSCLDASGKCGS